MEEPRQCGTQSAPPVRERMQARARGTRSNSGHACQSTSPGERGAVVSLECFDSRQKRGLLLGLKKCTHWEIDPSRSLSYLVNRLLGTSHFPCRWLPYSDMSIAFKRRLRCCLVRLFTMVRACEHHACVPEGPHTSSPPESVATTRGPFQPQGLSPCSHDCMVS